MNIAAHRPTRSETHTQMRTRKMVGNTRGCAAKGGWYAWAVAGVVAISAAPVMAGFLYRSTLVVEDDVICVGCVTKVTVTVADVPICEDQEDRPLWPECDGGGQYPLATCPPKISSFVASLTISGGACFVTSDAACGVAECVEAETCVHGSVTCPPPDPGEEPEDCALCTCGPSCQAFNISPGGTRTFWIKGVTPGYSTVSLHGSRPCQDPPPGGQNEGYHEFEDEAEFTVLLVDLDTDSDNDGIIGVTDDPIENQFPGRYLWPNADDDNDNDIPDMNESGPIANENDLAKIQLSVLPADYEGTATLTWPASVKVWMDAQKTTPASGSWAVANLPSTLWVEGQDAASTADLTLSVSGCSDTVKITVFKVASITWETYLDNLPLDTCPTNGGQRIFPGKKDPDDAYPTYRISVTVFGMIEPAPPPGSSVYGVPVYLKHWDVDDPSADGNVVDNLPAGVPNSGPDNRGGGGVLLSTVVGTWEWGGFYGLLDVTMKPGDNFCVAGTTTPQLLDNRMVQADAEAMMPNGGARAGARITEMLTVWRKLWVERDTMAAATGFPVVGTVDSITLNSPVAGQSTIDLGQNLADDHSDLNLYEEGDIGFAACPAGLDVFPVVSNTSNFLTDDEVVVLGLPGACANGSVYSSWDDDVQGILPHYPSGGAILGTAFATAYILPVYAGEEYQDVIPFEIHLNDLEMYQINNARDLTSSPAFWACLIVGCWEPGQNWDADPDVCFTLTPPFGPPPGAEGAETGRTETDKGEAAIFMQTIQDDAACMWITDEAHTVTHEIGHTCREHDHHVPNSIMQEGAPRGQNQFAPESIDIFRDQGTW